MFDQVLITILHQMLQEQSHPLSLKAKVKSIEPFVSLTDSYQQRGKLKN